jgi:subtilase family serine protease
MKSPTHAISNDRSRGKMSALRARRRYVLERVSNFEILEPRRLLSASKLTKSTANVAHTNYVVISQNVSKPADSSSVGGGLTPAEIRHVYGVDQITFGGDITGDGTGETIAIVDAYDDPDIQSDLNTFDAQFDLPNITVTRVSQSGSTTNLPGTDSTGGWETEESLDVEWAHAIAPGANILLVEASSTSSNNLYAGVTWAKAQPGVVAVSMSFGSSETSNEASQYDSIFTSPSGKGVTFLAATGDDGEPSEYPAYSPNVVAVGGTVLSVPPGGGTNFTGAYTSETGWGNPIIASATESGNKVTITISAATPVFFSSGDSVTIAGVANSSYDGTFKVTGTGTGANQLTYTLNNFSNLPASSGGTAIGANNGGSGGGQSTVESEPSYQDGLQNITKRANPDVSLAATFLNTTNDVPYGVDVYDSFDDGGTPWVELGGTSLATPMWAGLIAIADQGRSLLGLGSLDGRSQTLPLLYELPSSDFHDITSGNNGFSAGSGYDLVTGLGTPIANLVVAGLVGTTVSGTVFNDVNSNGVQDSGESGLAGWTVYDDLNDNGVLDTATQTSYSSSNVPMSIPARTTINSTLTISSYSETINDLNVTLNITDPSDSNLTITLTSPGGTQITLASRDGNGSNFTGTVFDDQATTSISSGSSPFSGSYTPITTLSAVNGTSPNGTWTLSVSNSSRFSTGTLNSWSLQITSPGDVIATTDANGNYEFFNVAPGTHYIREVTPANYTETEPASGVYQITVSYGANITGLNFGNYYAAPVVVGDFNRNGQLDGGDILAAMMALTNLNGYLAAYQVTPQQLATYDDVNQDGHFTNADLQALLNLLMDQGGGNSSPTVTQNTSSPAAGVQTAASDQSILQSPVSDQTAVRVQSAVSTLPIASDSLPVAFDSDTDPEPVTKFTVNADGGAATPSSVVEQLLIDDLRDKPLAERYRVRHNPSGEPVSLEALEKFFAGWPR